MKKILITGVAGFIGSNLCQKLLDLGYRITGIDNFDSYYDRKIKEYNMSDFIFHPSFTFIELDLCNDISILERYEFEVVIHLAARAGVQSSIINIDDYINNNIIGTKNILELMKKINCKKIIFSSSSSIYGNSSKTMLQENDDFGFPLNPYAVTKKTCELLLHNYYNIFDFNIVILRFFSVYGKKLRPDLVMCKFANLIFNNKPLPIYGDWNSKRDYTEINDVLNAIILSICFIEKQNKGYEIFNIGNGNPISLCELVKEMYRLLKKSENIIYYPNNIFEMKVTCANITKAQKVLGYNPQVKFNDGINNYLKWFINASNSLI